MDTLSYIVQIRKETFSVELWTPLYGRTAQNMSISRINILHHFLYQSEVKSKPIVACFCKFSCAWLHVSCLLFFCIATLSYWLKNILPLSPLIRSDLLTQVDWTNGFACILCDITLVWVLWYSVEKCSNQKMDSLYSGMCISSSPDWGTHKPSQGWHLVS